MRALAIMAVLALAGCSEQQAAEHYAHLTKVRAERERGAAYQRCLFEAKGYFGTASLEVMKHCEERATERGEAGR